MMQFEGPAVIFGALAGGFSHSLAVRDDGTVWAWGRNQFGQLGTGNTNDARVATQVLNLTEPRPNA